MQNKINNERFRFFNRIVNSVAGIKHCKEVLRESVGRAILYLFLYALIFGVIASITGAIKINSGISEVMKEYNDKCPNFELKNGELSIDEKMPLVLSENKEDYFAIDTTNSISPEVLNSCSKGVLILKDKMIQKKNETQTQITDFKSFQGFDITKDKVNKYLPYIRIIIPFIFVGNVLWYFLGGLLSSLVLALFALIVNSSFKTELKFSQLYSISIYSLTTPILINTIYKIVTIEPFRFYWLFYHLIAFSYVCFAINKIRKTNQNIEIYK